MSEEHQADVVVDEVVAHQEQTDTPQESQAAEPVAPEPTQKEKDQEYNWRRMRETMEELQRQNQSLEHRLDERSKPSKVEDDTDEIDSLPDDELLTKAQTKRLAAKAAKRAAEEVAHSIVKQRDLDTLDDRVRMRYTDYNSIVTPQNLEELKSDPLFVKSLKGLADPFDQACFVYEQLKLRGRDGTEALERKKVEENAAKPRSQQALGGPSPLHAANQYAQWPDPALRDQLFKEMQEAAKGA